MNLTAILISTSLAILGVGCNSNSTYVPSDAETLHYHSVIISVTTEGNDDIVEVGLISGVIFEPGLLVGNNGIWSNGSPASVAIGVTSMELQSIVSSLTREFTDIKPVYTYSEWISGAKRDPSLGLYTSQYLASKEPSFGVWIRFSGVKDNYNRSMWLFLPESGFDSSLWNRLEMALPIDVQFSNLLEGLRTFWINNA